MILLRWGRVWMLTSCSLLATVSLLFSGLVYHSAPPGIYFVDFALGVFFADLAINNPQAWLGRLCAVTSLATCLILFFHLEHGESGKFTDVVLGMAAASFMAYCLLNPLAKPAALLSHRWLVVLGLFSYGLYLIHFPLLQVFWELCIFPLHISRIAGFALVASAGTSVILLLSYGFYWLFERPFTSSAARKLVTAVIGADAAAGPALATQLDRSPLLEPGA